jgi:hypothetical protein
MLTLSNLRNHVTHALGGSPSTDLPPSPAGLPSTTANSVADMIINSAGTHLFSMHPWRFKMGPSITRDFVANQDYISLPNDFGSIRDVRMTSGANNALTLTSISQLEYYRTSSIGAGLALDYWCALSWPPPEAQNVAPPPPRLEFWPTPTSASAGAVTLTYLRRWVPLYQTTDVAAIPDYAESLLAQLVRAFASGWEDEAAVPLEPRLQMVENGPVCDAAKVEDGMQQGEFGYMRGGPLQSMYPLTSWRSATTGVADPS